MQIEAFIDALRLNLPWIILLVFALTLLYASLVGSKKA